MTSINFDMICWNGKDKHIFEFTLRKMSLSCVGRISFFFFKDYLFYGNLEESKKDKRKVEQN
jgi:hypothetical protein